MTKALFRLLLPLAVCVAIGGCAEAGSVAADLITSTTSATPTQARTVGDAIRLCKLMEDGLDLYVTSGHASRSVVDELLILVPALHNTLVKAEDAQRSGNSAAIAAGLAAFNEALAAVRAYEVLKGVKS